MNEEFIKQIDKDIADEQEAIEAYDKTIALTDDPFIKEQLEKIKVEEEAHKKYLEEVKTNPKVKYGEEETNTFEEINKKRIGE